MNRKMKVLEYLSVRGSRIGDLVSSISFFPPYTNEQKGDVQDERQTN